jgi:hypothetical protein
MMSFRISLLVSSNWVADEYPPAVAAESAGGDQEPQLRGSFIEVKWRRSHLVGLLVWASTWTTGEDRIVSIGSLTTGKGRLRIYSTSKYVECHFH